MVVDHYKTLGLNLGQMKEASVTQIRATNNTSQVLATVSSFLQSLLPGFL